MSCCCESGGALRPAAVDVSLADDARRSGAGHGMACRPLGRSVFRVIQWAGPVAVLALVPKCPACVAAYVLMFTGVGLSYSAAAGVRWAVIGMSVGLMGWVVVCAARRLVRNERHHRDEDISVARAVDIGVSQGTTSP